MWNEPYLETCCRSALHRLFLTHGGTRPAGLPDEACLRRLCGMGMAEEVSPGRFAMTEAGAKRHASEVLKKAAA
ncbi:hypothetical protein SAMN02745194_03513 [Roseomonas rosea]|jgi:hypothetical protein|uniref:Uncharacterized protein n=1 Tax=Muricoccus roseus TaxID=198092 RepID=A0A1M6ML58_9PROT|nr:hypothetical protein [Roseomonas rosea]SHJ84182.1 hypothetical protein SAMN02745194_03513 [Roseomonas rosea]